MTKDDSRKQKEIEQYILKEIQRRKRQGVSGDDCETEYKTNAEVCVEITSVNLDCSESFLGNYYSDCVATIYYDVKTDYRGSSFIDLEIEGRVEIEYEGRDTYFSHSDSSYKYESHNLYSYENDSESMSFDFLFSSLDEITSVKVSSAECEIISIELY